MIDVAYTAANDTDYQFGAIMQDLGAYHVMRGGTDTQLTLWFIDPARAVTPVAPGIFGFNGAMSVKTLRGADLGVAWGNFAISTQRLAGARSAGDTFTHVADGWVRFKVTALSSGAPISVRFREVDASNYWEINIDSTGALVLNETVAGVPTARSTTAAAIAANDIVLVTFYGTTIQIIEGNPAALPYTRRTNYASASNFQAATAGRIASLGTGGGISDLITEPRYITNVTAPLALSQFNRFAPSFP